MKIDLKKIINIKTKDELNYYKLDKPIFLNNYLFHYLIELGNLDALKLFDFPVYIMNSENLDGFHLAAKNYNLDILLYLIKNIQNIFIILIMINHLHIIYHLKEL
jgi:hypothetical protein